jgi:iron-sulfur cluster assembly accessory protein
MPESAMLDSPGFNAIFINAPLLQTSMTEFDLQDFARQPDGSFKVTGDMIIGDVVLAFPQAVPIMLSHGLHCVGCHANAFDTVEDGSRGHGMPDEEILEMIEEINAAINRKIENVEMTEIAVMKVKELRSAEEGKEDWPLRIAVTPGDCAFNYDMDFGQERPGDITFMCGDLKVVVDPESFPLLKGSTIDYVESLSASGFRIENPNAKRSC